MYHICGNFDYFVKRVVEENNLPPIEEEYTPITTYHWLRELAERYDQ